MTYCTYQEYSDSGGTLPEETFNVYAARASRLIDGATFGRAEPHAETCERCKAALADACVQIVGALVSAASLTSGTCGYAPGVSHVNNDGFEVTFASNSSMSSAIKYEAYCILQSALGNDPHNLLYRGLDG